MLTQKGLYLVSWLIKILIPIMVFIGSMKNIPIRCQEAREKEGLSIRELSTITGLDRRTIKGMEAYTGKTPKTPLNHFELYAKGCNTSVEKLLFGNLINRTSEDDLRRIRRLVLQYYDLITGLTDKKPDE